MRYTILLLLVFVSAIPGCEKSHENGKSGTRNTRHAKSTDPTALAADKNREDAKKAFERGLALFDTNDFDAAIVAYSDALRLDPKLAQVYSARANVWSAKKEYAKAIADWSDAIRLNPKDKASMLSAANYLAMAGDAKIRDGKRALELAKKAFEIDMDDARCLITMAGAYAETGDFENAVRWQERAVQHPQTLEISGARAVLKLYQNKQPNRLVD